MVKRRNGANDPDHSRKIAEARFDATINDLWGSNEVRRFLILPCAGAGRIFNGY